MSNLSELLPTGGGQNVVSVVASGTISSGEVVALNSDGTVSAVASDGIPQEVGSSVVFESASTSGKGVAYDPVNNKVIICYRDDGNSNYVTSVVGTVSGTDISFGAPQVIHSVSSNYITATALPTGSVVVTYAITTSSYASPGRVGTISGSSITWGSATNFADAYDRTVAYDPPSGKLVVMFRETSANGKACLGTVNGTSITWTAPQQFDTPVIPGGIASDTVNKKLIFTYRQYLVNQGRVMLVEVQGNKAFNFYPYLTFASDRPNQMGAVYDTPSGNVAITWQRAADSNGYARTVSISGTSISLGTIVSFASNITNIVTSYSSLGNKIVLAYSDITSVEGKVITGAVSGTSISFGTAAVFVDADPDGTAGFASAYVGNAKSVIAYTDYSDNQYGKAFVFQNTATNVADTIGIADGAISNGATGTVNVYGGVNASQTGLTVKSNYYAATDGSITLAAANSSVALGQAITSSKINLKDNGVPVSIEYLVVAGGGGAFSSTAGGGGAGGLLHGTTTEKAGTVLTVTVGAGGYETQGSDSSVLLLNAYGGGKSYAGAGWYGVNGGSGGGANYQGLSYGGFGISGQGNNGGRGHVGGGISSNDPYSSGGGGGAGAAGEDGTSTGSGDGGIGRLISIDGTSTYYAGGGGAGADNARRADSAGLGGLGGGGDGGSNSFNDNTGPKVSGQNGAPNSGGGGGGKNNGATGTSVNGAGGSGVVILRLNKPAFATTGSPTVTTIGGETIYKFTGSGSITL